MLNSINKTEINLIENHVRGMYVWMDIFKHQNEEEIIYQYFITFDEL